MPVAGPTLFALASALSYGAGDFIGGRAATRLSTLSTLLIAQLAACALAMLVASGVTIEPVSDGAFALGALGGIAHVAAVGLLYHGLAHGRVTVVAPISGVTNIALPVIVDGIVANGLSLVQGAGILLSSVAVVLVTRGARGNCETRASLRLSLVLGAVSGLLFGVADLSLGSVEASGAEDAVLAARLTGAASVFLVYLAVQRHRIAGWVLTTPARRFPQVPDGRIATGIALALLAGLFDCLGHLTYVMSAALGEISIAVATSALFPAVSVVLAIVVLKEGIGRLQSLGLGVSVGAVALLAGA